MKKIIKFLKIIGISLILIVILFFLWGTGKEMYKTYKYREFLKSYDPGKNEYQEKLLTIDDNNPDLIAYEEEAIKIDEYNFEQLEKVKLILKDIPINELNFRNLNEFNNNYNKNIIPIKNCYYLSRTKNLKEDFNDIGTGYMFGFKLESRKYQKQYNREYFVYPKYNLSYWNVCYAKTGSGGLFNVIGTNCYDKNWGRFKGTISKVCQN